MKTRVSFLILVITIVFFNQCKKSEESPGHISGTVTDASTNQPLQGAKVKLISYDSVITASDGQYIFKNLKAGSYQVEVSKDSYEKKTTGVVVTSGNTSESNFSLAALPAPVISDKYLDFGIDSINKHFSISYTGNSSISYSMVVTQSWISVNPSTGTLNNNSVRCKVTLNKDALPKFVQHAKIILTSISGQVPVKDTIEIFANGVMDNDKNYYDVIVIGTQTWMAQNLKVGIVVSGGSDQSDLQVIKKYYYGNITANGEIYGGLYTWPGIMKGAAPDNSPVGTTRGICPVGWHLPSVGDFTTLIDYLDGTVAGLKLKETGTSHWSSGTLATNESGFTALPGGMWDGYSYSLGPTEPVNKQAYFWTTSNDASGYHFATQLEYNSEQMRWKNFSNNEAVSVRCLKNK